MGVTQAVLSAHIQSWEKTLAATNRPHRRYWPSRLFRHEPAENAAAIIQSGQLLSRSGAMGLIKRDIAPPAILQNAAFAQDYVRLYFRPKSPTQYHIEGIRKQADYYNGKHAPILVIFVFRAAGLLNNPGVMFSDGNMQSNYTSLGNDDAFFQSINFDNVFHEGSFDSTNPANFGLIRERCAEALLPSPLPLNNTLEAILCRSSAERTTLIHMLGQAAQAWESRIVVQSAPGIFENRHVYLDEVAIASDGISFRFNPTSLYPTVKTELIVQGVGNAFNQSWGPWQLDPRKRWKRSQAFEDGTYNVKFIVEDCLAYEANLLVDSLPF